MEDTLTAEQREEKARKDRMAELDQQLTTGLAEIESPSTPDPEPPPVEPDPEVQPGSDDPPPEPGQAGEEPTQPGTTIENPSSPPEELPPEPQKGTAEHRKWKIQSEINDLTRQKKDAERELEEVQTRRRSAETPAAPASVPQNIELLQNDPGEFQFQHLKPEDAERFTNAQLFMWHNQAKDEGNSELANRYLQAIDEKERYELHKKRKEGFLANHQRIAARRNESVARARKEHPAIYDKSSSMYQRYQSLAQDPEFSEIVSLISRHPDAPLVMARITSALMRSENSSVGELEKKVREQAAEIERLKKPRQQPKSNSAGGAAPPVPNGGNGNLTPEQKLDQGFDRLVATHGRKVRL